MNNDIGQILFTSINSWVFAIANFIPKFVAGLILFLIGVIIAYVLKQGILGAARVLRVESFLKRYGVPEGKEEFSWSNILAEIVRWFVIIAFLIPTADIWGLPQVNTVLTAFLLYIPQVLVATIIILVGFVLAKLAYDVVLASTHSLSVGTSKTIATMARYAIVVFAFLAALNQLGIASDLVRILFTGFVAMVALSGGIAFGLGGQGVAKSILEDLKKKLK